MPDALSGLLAMAKVSLREMQRQQLWLLVVLPAIVLAIVVPQLKAVDPGDQLRLGVMATLSSMGFMATLLGILVAAGFQRRDREQQLNLMLFSKPLGYGSYLWGRWLGLTGGLFIGLLLMAAGGTLGLLLGLGRIPPVRAVSAPSSWTAFNSMREERVLHEQRLTLSGNEGDGVRWLFTGLDAGAGDAEVLLRARVRHRQPGWPLRRARVEVAVFPAGDPSQLQLLQVSPDSPYGQRFEDGRAVDDGAALLTDRSQRRDDLEEDYLRLSLPASAMSEQMVLQLVRLDPHAVVTFDRDSSALISRPAGGFLFNVLGAVLVICAQAGMLAAITSLVACLSNLGVCLLAGLTVYFAGHSLDLIDELLRRGEHGRLVSRFFEFIHLVIPDLQYPRLPIQLAGGHAIDWMGVFAAWGYYGSYTCVALFLAWLVMRRRTS